MEDLVPRIARSGGPACVAAMRLTCHRHRDALPVSSEALVLRVAALADLVAVRPHAPLSVLLVPSTAGAFRACLDEVATMPGTRVLKMAECLTAHGEMRGVLSPLSFVPHALAWVPLAGIGLAVLQMRSVHVPAGVYRLPWLVSFTFDECTYPGLVTDDCDAFFDLPALERLSVGMHREKLLMAPFTRHPCPSVAFLELDHAPVVPHWAGREVPEDAQFAVLFPRLRTVRCRRVDRHDGAWFVGCRRLEVAQATDAFVLPAGLDVLSLWERRGPFSFAPGAVRRIEVEPDSLPSRWWEAGGAGSVGRFSMVNFRLAEVRDLLPHVVVLDLRGALMASLPLDDLRACARLEELRYCTSADAHLQPIGRLPCLRQLEVTLLYGARLVLGNAASGVFGPAVRVTAIEEGRRSHRGSTLVAAAASLASRKRLTLTVDDDRVTLSWW